jgi:starch phosphorylase
MRPIQKFTVSPVLPDRLKRLREIAFNLWWTWDAEAREIFRRLDLDLWEEVRHNPVLMLARIDQEVLEKRVNDESYLYQLDKVLENYDYMLQKTSWFQAAHKSDIPLNVTYFSMEYGITESLAVYSGGLGVLSGDHLKSSSDLGIPLTAVGLSYQNGYFQQSINIDDWQEEKVAANDFYNMPLNPVTDKEGNRVLINLPFPGRTVFAQLWRADVGRIPLYLLDTNVDENSPEDRKITAELYGGDREMRIKQEVLLGMGGIRALKAINAPIGVYHLNEGHSAFSNLERIKNLVQEHQLNFYEALEVVKSSSIFTTHTPVQAGIDLFAPELVEKYFRDYCKDIGITINELLALGRRNPNDLKEEFSMAILAIKLSFNTNAVSKLHAKVSRNMWKSLWPDVLTDEIPISGITNGIHHASWVSREMADLYYRYLGPEWFYEPTGKDVWKNIYQIPDSELWRTHSIRRERLVAFVRRSLTKQYQDLGKPAHEIERVKNVLNTDALTIGFARRFATYKRASLIFRDPDRLAEILSNTQYPVQIIIAGKAHPQDVEGKKIIQRILKLSHEERFYQSVVFLENYDINLARYMVQGCDLWLNNPRRGLEACGTSGMKAAINGCLNFSTLDGWWDEVYRPGIGWCIGDREIYDDEEYWDQLEMNIVYNVLDKEVIPSFYYRDNDRLPRDWVKRMKASIVEICQFYNTNRMLSDYTNKLYIPSANRTKQMQDDSFRLSKELANWKKRLRENWKLIRFLKVETSSTKELSVKNPLNISTEIFLDGISQYDIELQIYYGKVNTEGIIIGGKLVSMQHESDLGTNKYRYTGVINNWDSGLNGFTIRVIPKHEGLIHPFEEGLIHWFEG